MSLAALFAALAAQAAPSTPFATVPCPDQWAGWVSPEGVVRWHLDADRRTGRAAQEAHAPRLILVLESPHRFEFSKSKPPLAIGPAQGPTGASIRNHLASALGPADVARLRTPRSLLLVNAVQYQCSLDQPTAQHRDWMFLHMWREGGRTDFCARMRQYVASGDIVVNACTRGAGKEPLRAWVDDALAEVLSAVPGTQLLRRAHPSSRGWWRDGSSWKAASTFGEVQGSARRSGDEAGPAG